MKKYFNSAIGFFRTLAFVEGTSLLVIIFIGMPLKYWADLPGVVKAVGPIHGILFVLFIIFAFVLAFKYKWGFLKTGLIMLSSFVPFGTFVVDHKVLKPLHQE